MGVKQGRVLVIIGKSKEMVGWKVKKKEEGEEVG